MALAGLGAAILAAALTTGVACGPSRSASDASADAPSVVLVTVDTLRADHLGIHGYPRPTSPNLDRLAARGTIFRNAFSTSSCTAPSHTSILTGLYPSFHTVGSYNGAFKVAPEIETLAEILSRHGYATAAVVSNPVLRAELGLSQGFDSYDDDLRGRELNRDVPERYADDAVDRALAVLDRLRGEGDERPFFLWLHLQDPHGPYTPPEETASFPGAPIDDDELPEVGVGPMPDELPLGDDHSGDRAVPRYQEFHGVRRTADYVRRYDGEIAFMDRELGRLLERLDDLGLLDGGLVAVTSDHGEAMGEDGYFFSHCNSVGEDQVRVPLILAGAGVPAGHEVGRPVTNAALFRTVLAAAGLGDEATTAVAALEEAAGADLGLQVDGATPPGLVPAGLSALLEPFRGTGPAGAGRAGVAAASGAATGPAVAAPEPVYLESLNQVGVVDDNTLLRRDRVPPSDEEFWSGGNPNTHGSWRSLGRSAIRPLDPSLPAPEAELADLEAMLASYRSVADAAAEGLEPLRQTTRLPRELEEMLRAQGYVR